MSEKKRKLCKYLTLDEKKAVIDESGTGESGRKLGKKFGVDKKVIGNILKSKDGILSEYGQNTNPNRKRSIHSTKHDELNEKIYELFVAAKIFQSQVRFFKKQHSPLPEQVVNLITNDCVEDESVSVSDDEVEIEQVEEEPAINHSEAMKLIDILAKYAAEKAPDSFYLTQKIKSDIEKQAYIDIQKKKKQATILSFFSAQ